MNLKNVINTSPAINNIWKYYVASLLGGFAFFYNAIDTLYYRHFGLSFEQIGWIISAGLISSLIMEVPTGAFADLYGKKKSLVISAISNFVGTALVALGNSFPLFLLGFVFWGIGRAFSSGASSALLYDTLKSLGRENDFLKHSGRLSAFFVSIDVISGALAPLLFAVNVRLPFFISLGAALMVVVIQLSLFEVSVAEVNNIKPFRDSFSQIVAGIKFALKNRIFLWLVLFNILIFTANKAFAEMISTPFLIHYVNFSFVNLSVIGVVGSIMQAAFVFFADKLEGKLGDKYSFLCIVMFFPITLVLYAISRNYLITALLSGIYFSTVSFSEVVVENYLAHNVSDDKRATILSISSMIVSFAALISLPLIGVVVDNISMQNSIIMLGILVLVIGTLLQSSYKSAKVI